MMRKEFDKSLNLRNNKKSDSECIKDAFNTFTPRQLGRLADKAAWNY